MMAGVSIRDCGGLVLAGLLVAAPALAQGPPRTVAIERTGSYPAREGGRLKLVTDLGSVRVTTQAGATQVSYRVTIQADSSQADAKKLVDQFNVSAKGTSEGVWITGTVPWSSFRGRLLVNYEVQLPRRYDVDISTNAGNVRLDEIDGEAVLNSAGGNLVARNIGGPAKLETKGGHIIVMDVGGSLVGTTLGGHIYAGRVKGDGTLRSGGGHVTVTSIGGRAQLSTDGGNISLERGGGTVTATTAGGRIDVGEAAGAIRARSEGGGIRVVRLEGPTQLQTAGGSIYLTRVQGAVRAATGSGGITAWIPSSAKIQAASELECSHGDIVLYLPRELAITIDASVEGGGEHRIDAPGLPLKIVSSGKPGAGTLRGEVALNGGGERLRLRALHGNVRLRFIEEFQPLYERIFKAHMEAFERMREWEQSMMEEQSRKQEELRRREEQLKEKQKQEEMLRDRRSRLQEWSLRMRETIAGRIPVNAEDQSKKLVADVMPKYPEQARREGIEGIVWLEVNIDRDGRVEEINVIEGHPLLAQAAADAVRQWRYSPTYVGEKPVAVTTVVRLAFRLN
jgi:TonB family protein